MSGADRDRLQLGRGGCGATVPDLERGDEVWVRARAVDLSGNEGPWSDAVHLRSVGGGWASPGGCASTGGGSAPLTVALAALGLALGARSRRPR